MSFFIISISVPSKSPRSESLLDRFFPQLTENINQTTQSINQQTKTLNYNANINVYGSADGENIKEAQQSFAMQLEDLV